MGDPPPPCAAPSGSSPGNPDPEPRYKPTVPTLDTLNDARSAHCARGHPRLRHGRSIGSALASITNLLGVHSRVMPCRPTRRAAPVRGGGRSGGTPGLRRVGIRRAPRRSPACDVAYGARRHPPRAAPRSGRTGRQSAMSCIVDSCMVGSRGSLSRWRPSNRRRAVGRGHGAGPWPCGQRGGLAGRPCGLRRPQHTMSNATVSMSPDSPSGSSAPTSVSTTSNTGSWSGEDGSAPRARISTPSCSNCSWHSVKCRSTAWPATVTLDASGSPSSTGSSASEAAAEGDPVAVPGPVRWRGLAYLRGMVAPTLGPVEDEYEELRWEHGPARQGCSLSATWQIHRFSAASSSWGSSSTARSRNGRARSSWPPS